jgi:DNA repair protein RadC
MTSKEIVDKTLYRGRMALTDAELISLLANLDIETSRKMVYQGYSLKEFARFTPEAFKQQYDLSDLKASKMVACFELARRMIEEESRVQVKISCSNDSYHILKHHFFGLDVEKGFVLFMDRVNKVIRIEEHSSGSSCATLFEAKTILKRAFELNASGLIVAHNHPSGSLKPSEADRSITKIMIQAAKAVDLTMMDHLIITDSGYLSFADEGML